jgi:predicted O-linked N-acetylglucosamine transferase (SPINDLY family)
LVADIAFCADMRVDVSAVFANAQALASAGRLDAALLEFLRAVALAPHRVEPATNLAVTSQDLGLFRIAVVWFSRAYAIAPESAVALFNLGNGLRSHGRLTAARRCYARSIAIDPSADNALNNFGLVLLNAGLVGAAVLWFGRAEAVAPLGSDAGINRLFALAYVPNVDGDALFAAQHAWGRRRLPSKSLAKSANFASERTLNVGYLSGDFRRHPVADNVEGLIAGHDPSRVKVHLYSNVRHPDEVTERFARYAVEFRDIVGMTDEQVASAVVDDGIDIFVGLACHTKGNRAEVLAQRVAPVQVSMHNIGSTGLSTVDWWITDDELHPVGATERFTERLFRIPSFYLFHDRDDRPKPADATAVERRRPTFGSCSNPAKLTPVVIALWARLLQNVSEARLILRYGDRFLDSGVAERYRRQFAEFGVARRVDLIGGSYDRASHLGLLSDIDVVLDPFPFNGATATFEALWMGIPVVTLMGDRFVGRVGAGLLRRLGLGALVASTPQQYIDVATAAIADRRRLGHLRENLRDRVRQSALCDDVGYARTMDAAYRTMWRLRCRAAGFDRGSDA